MPTGRLALRVIHIPWTIFKADQSPVPPCRRCSWPNCDLFQKCNLQAISGWERHATKHLEHMYIKIVGEYQLRFFFLVSSLSSRSAWYISEINKPRSCGMFPVKLAALRARPCFFHRTTRVGYTTLVSDHVNIRLYGFLFVLGALNDRCFARNLTFSIAVVSPTLRLSFTSTCRRANHPLRIFFCCLAMLMNQS